MENKSKHTPGPWKVLVNVDDGARVADANGNMLLEHIGHPLNCGRDMELAAAAPELLAALEQIAEMADNSGDKSILETARAAIAKAKGE